MTGPVDERPKKNRPGPRPPRYWRFTDWALL